MMDNSVRKLGTDRDLAAKVAKRLAGDPDRAARLAEVARAHGLSLSVEELKAVISQAKQDEE